MLAMFIIFKYSQYDFTFKISCTHFSFQGTVRYSNDLVVQRDAVLSSPEDIYFGVYCSFQSRHDINVLGIRVDR